MRHPGLRGARGAQEQGVGGPLITLLITLDYPGYVAPEVLTNKG